MTTIYICSVSTTGKNEPDTVYTYIPVVDGMEEQLYSIITSHRQKDGTWRHRDAPNATVMATIMHHGWAAINVDDLPPAILKRLPNLGHKKHWYSMDIAPALVAPKPPAPKKAFSWRRMFFVAVLVALVVWLYKQPPF
jgi:hypothetical protein